MTREELIRNLKYTMKKHESDNVPTCGTNISIMCKDILDYLEQEPCEDAVSRKAVHNMLEDIPIVDTDKWFNWLQKACLRLADLPSVTPTKCIATVKFSKDDMRELIDEKMKDIVVERKKGKWIEDYIPLPLSDGSKKCYQCSECRTHWDNVFNYCPNCGCFMSEGGKE